MNAVPADRLVAYQLMIDALPRKTDWAATLANRGDGTSPSGVFAALDALKMEYHSAIGDIVSGCKDVQERAVNVNATKQETVLAYALAIECMPRPEQWRTALTQRGDGTSPAEIFKALGRLRMDLHARIGDLVAENVT